MAHTAHGSHIPSTPMDETPAKVIACGGIWVCYTCMKEAGSFLVNRNNSKDAK